MGVSRDVNEEASVPWRAAAVNAVLPRTQSRYARAFSLFSEWCWSEFGVLPSSEWPARLMDELGAQFLGDLSEDFAGGMKSVGANLASGIFQALGFHFRTHLPTIGRVNKAWALAFPAESHAPLPAPWVDLLAVDLARHGCLAMGIGCLVLFDGFLRISELCGLTADALLLPEDCRSNRSGAAGLRIPKAKGGADQFAVLSDEVVMVYLRMLGSYSGVRAARLFPFSPADFNRALGTACQRLGLPLFTSHSFRHGAAANAALHGVDPETIRRRGRWSTQHAMDVYLQQVRSRLLLMETPAWLSPYLPRLPVWRTVLFDLAAASSTSPSRGQSGSGGLVWSR